MSLKKICFVIPGFGEGGAQRQCILLLNELAKRGIYDIHLIYFYEGVYWNELNKEGITPHKGDASSMWSFWALIHVFSTISKIRPAIVYSWLHSSDVFVGVSKLFRRPFIWIMAERNSYYPNELRYMIRTFFAKFADCVICNSNAGIEYWSKRGISHQKLKQLNNILFSPTGEDVAPPEKSIDFLYCGRFEMQKNIIFLAALFRKLIKLKPLNCYLVGNGSLRTSLVIENEFETNGALNIIPFQSNIFDFYRRAKVFVSLGLHEGTPNTVIENISIGNIVVVSKIPEHLDLLGPSYPFYWDLNSGMVGAVDVLNRALSSYEDKRHLDFANNKLDEMSACRVGDTYVSIFNEY